MYIFIYLYTYSNNYCTGIADSHKDDIVLTLQDPQRSRGGGQESSSPKQTPKKGGGGSMSALLTKKTGVVGTVSVSLRLVPDTTET